MTIFGFSVVFLKPTALVFNIFVSAISFLYFKKNKHFNWKLFYPFAIASIPSSFIGGYLKVDESLFKIILACFIGFSVLKILNVLGQSNEDNKQLNLPLALIFGSTIGLLSGMIGIGGGIVLSPLIMILGWGSIKETAAVSALFIFVNSVAGLTGFMFSGEQLMYSSFYFVPIVIVGGLVGSYIGSKKIENKNLKYLLVVVLVLAIVKLILL
jgi:uncharacterized membrane protein YfcA